MKKLNNLFPIPDKITPALAIAYYLDYVNNYLTIDKMADHHNITVEECTQLVKIGRKCHADTLSKALITSGKVYNKALRNIKKFGY